MTIMEEVQAATVLKCKPARARDHPYPLRCTALSYCDVLAAATKHDSRFNKVLRCNPSYPTVTHVVHVNEIVPVVFV